MVVTPQCTDEQYRKSKHLLSLVLECLSKEIKPTTNAINPTEETIFNKHNIKSLRPNFHLQQYGGLDTPTEPLAESDYKGRIKSSNKNNIAYFKLIDKLARKQKKKKIRNQNQNENTNPEASGHLRLAFFV